MVCSIANDARLFRSNCFPTDRVSFENIPIRSKEVVCILVFLSAMLRGAGAVLIYALRLPFLHL